MNNGYDSRIVKDARSYMEQCRYPDKPFIFIRGRNFSMKEVVNIIEAEKDDRLKKSVYGVWEQLYTVLHGKTH
ncbi:MAG: hypothetical protein Q7S74_01520 [Nanoarchaeota archaeon]|nr:hypothetical protein [Nanoarchaeota archaeon]